MSLSDKEGNVDTYDGSSFIYTRDFKAFIKELKEFIERFRGGNGSIGVNHLQGQINELAGEALL